MLEYIDAIKEAVRREEITVKKAERLISDIKFYKRVENILEWGKYYFPEKFNLPFCYELHNYLISIRNNPKTVTLAPRGYAKTIIKCFLVPIYQALNEPDTYRHYLNIQDTSGKAVDVNMSIKTEFETNERLKADYGDMVTDEKWTEKKFVIANGVVFSAIGCGDSVRGINYRNVRPDYVVVDDLYSEDDRNNIERIKKKNEWFWSSIYKCVAKGRPVSFQIQGTAINKSDIMHLLKDRKDWKFNKFQAIKDYDKKEVLWSEVESFESLMEDKETMGTTCFEREMQNNVRDEETSIIKERWLRFFDGAIPANEEVIRCVGALDPAVSEKQISDYSAKCIGYYCRSGNKYIVDLREEHLTLNENLKDCQMLHSKYKFNLFKIEEISAFQFIGQELKRTGMGNVLKEVKKVKDKITRLENVSPQFENGKVFFSTNINKRILDRAVDQLINNFPINDDIRDSIVLFCEDDNKPLFFAGAA